MLRLLLTAAVALTTLASCDRAAGDTSGPVEERQGPVLKRFGSTRAFEAYVEELRRKSKLRVSEAQNSVMEFEAAAPAADASMGEAAAQATIANPEITNNQTVGVDEGGIVKQVGRYLVMLQDGRLFSADLGAQAGASLRLADRTDVYRNPSTAADWYDEMLVLGDRILVTAYNYRERASEITVFRIDPAGRFTREGRFLLSSDDYYSTENYATRLVGDQLVFYAPFAIGDGGPIRWPTLRRADGDGEADEGEALIGPTDVYAPPGESEWPVVHTVSVCPLKQDMDCRTTAFVGPPMREFYVSPTDAFLWIGAPDGLPWSIEYGNQRRKECTGDSYWRENEGTAAMLYRLPLDGSAIGAVAAEGIPADQFAFDSRGGRFRALLSRPGPGCVAANESTPLALLDIPLSAFGDRVRHVAPAAYASLPSIEGGQLENRFVGEWLVYGGRTDWSSLLPIQRQKAGSSSLFAVPLARPAGVARLVLPHNAIRIERAGSDAVVTGYRGSEGLSLSYVSLQGARPAIASTAILPRRVESEGRSHAFNAWIRPDGSGLIGLPTSLRTERSLRGWSDSESSDLSFVALSPAKALAPAGELSLRGRKPAAGYDCKVSCIDWYGNSRPIFTGGRIFALLGTELVEGRIERGRIAELARLDLTGRPSGS
ncbi:MAG TPA: beta-propeller domain-containing protein [Allosphingosinicella sp.]|jgi:hypothetical protein